MDKILQEKFPFTSNFFENAISKDKLFHAYLLTGNNNAAKYAFALNIARILNCTGDKSENCQCLNCKWIRSNSHPAVMTFSPIDFVHVNDKGQARENLTVAQARFIKDELAKTSTYHRVLIITDATEGKEALNDYNELNKFNVKPPVQANQNPDETRIWAPKSLTVNTFTTDTANSLLKTIEEPFENVTFFFLANTQEDLIQTIVSRCQCVNIPSSPNFQNAFDLLEKFTQNYPPKDNLTALMLTDHIKNLSKENDMPLIDILELIENFYGKSLQNNLENSLQRRNIVTFLNKIETAKNQLNHYVNPDSVLENLFLN